MRAFHDEGGLSVRATAGTNTVLLGWDLADPAGCLGFGVHRTDHTEDEAYWLRGLKVFRSVVPHPGIGMDFSLRSHPVQGFQWGDYTAKPEHDYTYRVVAWGGTPGALTSLADVRVDVRTEAEDDGLHGIWFNRGVAGSQAFVKRFGQFTPPVGASEDHPAFAWLSRGLGEAFVRFVGRANGPEWGLRGAFYEFTWKTGLSALAAARDAGADVQLVVHGRDRDAAGKDSDTTAADNRAAVAAVGLDDVVTWRTAPNKSALQHNKFLVLTRPGSRSRCGPVDQPHPGRDLRPPQRRPPHRDPAVAQRFPRLLGAAGRPDGHDRRAAAVDGVDQPGRARRAGHRHDPLAAGDDQPLLDGYGDAFDGAVSSAHVTGAFGLTRCSGSGWASTGTSSVRCCWTRSRTPGRRSRRSTRTYGCPGGLPAQGHVRAVGGRAPDELQRLGEVHPHQDHHDRPAGAVAGHAHRVGQLLGQLDHGQRGEHRRDPRRRDPGR
jgi:hypothetical protein